ncbi:MAG: hypothetical protein J7578_17805, partial [Chitinophagaceae bacterium]|nr:hypothetical protein [Chitinophagaceae bacterium]
MIKFIISVAIVTGWIVLLDKGFPSDHDNANIYTIGSFLLLACWVAGGLIFILFKYKAPSIQVFIVLTLLSCIVVYNYFPWYKGYTGFQIIKDYAAKKKSTKEVDPRWIYSLPARIENYPLIDLAQRKFAKEINPDKCYSFQRFYYDSSGIQQYIDQYIIYFKDNKPFTTEPAIDFTQKPDGSYELQETSK